MNPSKENEALLTAEMARSMFLYQPMTGELLWKISPTTNIKPGSIAGGIEGSGYRRVMVNNRKYLSHRVAWLITHGEWPKEQIDHINHNRSDNRICNLRGSSRVENYRNQGVYKNNRSGVPGVIERKPGWYQVYITVNRKQHCSGATSDFFEACCLRKSAENRFNFHPNHGRTEA